MGPMVGPMFPTYNIQGFYFLSVVVLVNSLFRFSVLVSGPSRDLIRAGQGLGTSPGLLFAILSQSL